MYYSTRMGLFICRCGQPEEAPDYDNIGSYDGEKKLGMRHGKGVYYYRNGDIYDGEWKRGKMHGYGVYTYKDGTQKRGFFVDDEYIGENPGNHSAEPRAEDDDPARPLVNKSSESQIARLRQVQERLEEGNRRREERRKKREAVRQKYNLSTRTSRYQDEWS